MKKILQLKSIRNRLTFWFIFVAVLPLIFISAITYQQRAKAVENRSFEKITAIRDLKIKQISTWFYERFNDINTLARDPGIRALEFAFSQESSSQMGHDILYGKIRKYLNEYVRLHKDYVDAYIIGSVSSAIEISSNEHLEGESRLDNPYFTEPLKTGELFIKDIFYSRTMDRISMTISAPIRCSAHKNQHIIGVLVLRVNLDHTIYDLLGDRSGLGETGETLILNRELTVLNELRGYPNAPLNLKLDVEPAKLAAQGKTGVIKSLDHRGKTVLAAYGYVPTTGWGFVAKQDLSEINAPIKSMLTDLMLLMLLSLVAVYLASFYLSKTISKPVIEMTEVSKKIQAGAMSARNRLFPSNELGFLADSFNKMADSLEQQMQLQRQGSEIMDTIVSGQSISDFASGLLKKLMALTDSVLCSFYVLNEKNSRFECLSSIGMIPEIMEYYDAENFEGEFGIALATKKISHIKDIPQDTVFKFRTFTGTLLPKELITIPVMVGDRVTAIVSLAGLRKYTQTTLDLFNQPWLMGLNTAFSNLTANEKTKNLADQLKETNEELESQARILRSQAKELIQKTEELHQQNLELEIRRKEVEEANRLKSQFLSNMSHELRTPLNSIMALSKVLLLQTKEKISEEESSYLKIIDRNGKSLLELINDILDLSKIEAGKIDLIPRIFSPSVTIESILESLTPIAKEKGIQLTSEFSEELPRIESDEVRVNHIIQNLIGNAIKFTDKGGVTLSGGKDTQNIYIHVTDTGIGIPQDHLRSIFDEFRQVDGSASRKYEGTGLGLAIAYKTARMLGGDITVDSVLGKGSTFTLTLPIVWAEAKPVCAPVTSRPRSVIRPERKTILVIDDDPEAANLIASSLLQEGYNTIAVTSGSEALRLAESYCPFAITLDIMMPDMDGWEVLQVLKKNPDTKDIPVIIVSITKDRETGFALGAVGYVSKPVNKELLVSEIHKIGKPDRSILDKFSIMVVDDNKFERNEMARIIEKEGMRVITAENGTQCIDLLKSNVPDLLVLDLVMPQMDGFKVLDFIRSDQALKHIPVIIVTAKNLTDEDKDRLEGGVSSVLKKSMNTSETLIAQILEILTDLEKSAHGENFGN